MTTRTEKISQLTYAANRFARSTSTAGDLQVTAETIEALNEWLRMLVAEARAGGMSWNAIGMSLGITRQAAQQKYGKGA